MLFKNFTPFAGSAWETVDTNNRWFATTLVRAKFKLIKGEALGEWLWQLESEQGDLFAEDMFYQDDVESSVRYESDYVPYKPYADIVLNAKAHKPKGEFFKSWECGVKVYDENGNLTNKHVLAVKGPHKNLLREKVDEVAVRYEQCKGGVKKIKYKGEEDEEVTLDHYNPVGCGKFDLEDKKALCSVQIEYAGKPIKNIPPGFGFIHRSWKSRLDHAGTYDDDWIKNKHPLPPYDFSSFHNQGAHPNLIAKSYLKPGSKIELLNLIKNEEASFFVVPEYKFLAQITTNTEKSFVRMNLDTLVIDIEDNENFIVYASWRSYSPLEDDAISGEVMLIPNEEKQQEGSHV